MSASCSSVAWAVSAHPPPESSDTDDATEAGLQFCSVGRIGPFPSQLKVLKVGQMTVAVETVESKAEGGGMQVYAAVEKRGHQRSVEDLERKEDPGRAGWKKAKPAGSDESDWISSKSGSRILNASRPTLRKPWNPSIALAGTLRNDVLSPTAC